ncbi:MAG: endonuclease/exonuclease/phosphatase family protein [Planctomycetota bacterium]
MHRAWALAVLLIAAPTWAQTSVKIYDIQGAQHRSPLIGQSVKTTGIVTAVDSGGFYMQDPLGDGDNRTSDGLFLFTGGAPTVAVGDAIEVTGTVSEFIPGGASTGNLSTTQIAFPAVTVVSSGNALPAAVIVGRGGRIPPARKVISKGEIDPPINLQLDADAAANRFNPRGDGIDFYESLEGMRVRIPKPQAVSALNGFGEVFVVADRGADVEPTDALTQRGGIELQPDPNNRGDQNPERMQVQFDSTIYPGASRPLISVGSRLNDVEAVVSYSFGNFEFVATSIVTFTPARRTRPQVSKLRPTRNHVTIASYNVLNLSPQSSDDQQRATLANHIVVNLRTPDVIALQEIQDNNGTTDDGTTDDGTTDASQTMQALVDAILTAGGPKYEFFDIAPADGASGGIPGGNIRNAFFYNPKRVSFVGFKQLTDSAFDGTRRPLVGTFRFNGRQFMVINNHWSSRFGSTPVFGAVQPFVQAAEADREAQARAIHRYVRSEIKAVKDARIVVLGDFNTFQWTNDLDRILPGRGNNQILWNLIRDVKDDNVYTFIFEGNSQALDHCFVTKNLRKKAEFDIVHVNNDFPRVGPEFGSDHEPLLARFEWKESKSKKKGRKRD